MAVFLEIILCRLCKLLSWGGVGEGRTQVMISITLIVGECKYLLIYIQRFIMLKSILYFPPICNVSYLYINEVSSEYCLWYFCAFVSQREQIIIRETCIYLRVPLHQ